MMKRLLLIVSFVLLVLSVFPQSNEKTQDCSHHPELVGPCFTVHGRICYYNGNPTARIWVIGTKRLLGVSDRRGCSLPENLKKVLSFSTEVYGDFTICPFTASKPGMMQFVCVASAKNLVVKQKPQEH